MNPAIMLVDVVFGQSRRTENLSCRTRSAMVDTAADGASAVRCCLEMQPDLVLLYDSLPDIGSFELCHQIKKDPLNHLTPSRFAETFPRSMGHPARTRRRCNGYLGYYLDRSGICSGASRLLLRLRNTWMSRRSPQCLRWARSVDSKQNCGMATRSVLWHTQSNGRRASVWRRRPARTPHRQLASRYRKNKRARKAFFLARFLQCGRKKNHARASDYWGENLRASHVASQNPPSDPASS